MRDRFHTATGAIDRRDIVLVEVVDDNVSGWGEAAPFPGQDETIDELIAAAGTDTPTPTLAAAIDCATADLQARKDGAWLGDRLGAEQFQLPVSLAIGLGGDPVGTAKRARAAGVRRFKIKIAPGHVSHVGAVANAVPKAIIGLDANGSFEEGSVSELLAVQGTPISYLEEPCNPYDETTLARIRSIVDVPVFVDESVRSPADAAAVFAETSADGVVIKPGRVGLRGALAMIEHAEQSGKRWRLSGLLETGIGRAYTNLLAARPNAFVSDVAPAEWFLESDVTRIPMEGGEVWVPRGMGVGVEPDKDQLRRYTVETFEFGR